MVLNCLKLCFAVFKDGDLIGVFRFYSDAIDFAEMFGGYGSSPIVCRIDDFSKVYFRDWKEIDDA